MVAGFGTRRLVLASGTGAGTVISTIENGGNFVSGGFVGWLLNVTDGAGCPLGTT
jgi:hypothetical protein